MIMGKSKKSAVILFGILLLAVWAFSFLTRESRAALLDPDDPLYCKNCNVVIIDLTNARKDHLSAYGYDKDTTPSISKLAESGALFTNAFTQASRSIAAGISLQTSQYPYTHGTPDHLYNGVNPDSKTAAEIFSENGYNTAAFTSSYYFQPGPRFEGSTVNSDGLTRGFDTYENDLNVLDIVEWLNENKDDKFFLFLQGFALATGTNKCAYNLLPAPYSTMFDPDYENKNDIDYSICYWSNTGTKAVEGGKIPLWEAITLLEALDFDSRIVTGLAPEDDKKLDSVLFDEEDIEHLLALYDGNIAYSDAQIGEVLDTINQLGLDENTIIVLTADNGELLGENGKFRKTAFLTGTFNDAVLNIPLIMKFPNMQSGKQVDGLAQIIDIVPTLLEAVGISTNKAAQGKSLSGLIKNGEEVNEYVYAGTTQFRGQSLRHPFAVANEVNVIRNNDWKLINEIIENHDAGTTTETYELYNIREDPKELNNIFNEEDSIASDLKAKLSQWIVDTKN